MTDVAPPLGDPAAPPSRRLKYALIASLALNLVIIGAVAGTMYGWKHHGPRHGGHPRGEDFGLMGLTRVLPEERRKEVRKQLREERAGMRPMVEDVRAARRDAADRLAAEPFDRSVLEASLAAVTEKDRALREAAVKLFLGHVERLTPDERKMLAERWRHMSKPLPKRKKDKAKDED